MVSFPPRRAETCGIGRRAEPAEEYRRKRLNYLIADYIEIAGGIKLDVLILTGSKNDLGDIDGAVQTLKKFGISYELHISSAHRTLKRTVELVESAEKSGAKAVIAAAGMSAHLPGVVAAMTILPVIGVPLNASSLNGLDSLMSIVQMPAGIPVATTAIGKSGCVNAALLAVSILALSDKALAEKLKRYRKDMAGSVIKADEEINKKN